MGRPDLAIRNVRILDGTGAPFVEGDVEVSGGRVTAIGSAAAAEREVDGAGRVLAPGFVDVHTHDDGAVLTHPDMHFKLSQGVTSVVVGNCGFSAIPEGMGSASGLFEGLGSGFADLDAYAAAVEAACPALNVATQIGHNSMRYAAMGNEKRPPVREELEQMRGWVAQAMEQGAIGLSSGLVYQPGRYSQTEELIALAEVVAPFGGLYNTHMRNEGARLLDAVAETIRIGAEAGVGVNISHHKAAGRANWGKVVESLAKVDAANDAGADISLDVYPYIAGSGPMYQYFDLERVDLELAAAIRLASCPAFPDYEGRHLTDLAAETGETLDQLVVRIITAPLGKRTICIQFLMTEDDVVANLRHPLVMVGSDGIPDLDGRPHPRLWGTFPRVLGHYVRDQGVLGLEDAVRRMTSMSADRFGLARRGRIAEGAWADLVLFDAATVRDEATWDDPQLPSAGIDLVVVNGAVALDHGERRGPGTGRFLRYRRGG
ncbi:MAG: D-aminoacylase [Acidimicrobiia bacterium]|nr:D-aminoacylase [Acidimicrobiia bacterium]